MTQIDHTEQVHDNEVDAVNLLCPLPVLRAKQALDQMPDGAVLKLIATDPAAQMDIEVFVDQAGYELINSHHNDDAQVFYIRK